MAAPSSPGRIFWPPALSTLTFPADRIDLWKVSLDQPSGDELPAAETPDDELPDEGLIGRYDFRALSADESARARRFHFERDRMHFQRCRSALRNLLGRYLSVSEPSRQNATTGYLRQGPIPARAIAAREIRFVYSASGKPQLAAEQNPGALQFNVSHSAGIGLIAIGGVPRLGVDIEKIRCDVDAAALAERFFSARERTGLRALPDRLRVSGFYACWTRKEAFLKATGQGLSFPLADFSVTTHPDLAPQLEEIRGNEEAGQQWLLVDVSVADGYRATVASEGRRLHLQTYAWN